MKGSVLLAAVVLLAASCWVLADLPDNGLLHRLRTSPGFSVSVYANIPFARSLAVSPSGVIYVSSYSFEGIDGPTKQLTKVWAIVDNDGDLVPDLVTPVTGDLWVPNGIAIVNGNLYVALVDQVLVYRNVERNFSAPGVGEVVLAPGFLPTSTWHGWRYMTAGPDGCLYIAVGSPCNVPGDQDPECADSVKHPLYGTIVRFDPVAHTTITVAHGIRNSVGITFHPKTGDMWFTDNGRDNWGPAPLHNDRPPDELNHMTVAVLDAVIAGQRPPPHYGFPYCYGAGIVDPNFNTWGSCDNMTGAVQELAPHAAVLGLRFYSGSMFPASYAQQTFIAEHGSWDRQPPNGYRVSVVQYDSAGVPVSYAPFIDGWIDNNTPCVTNNDCPGRSFCQNFTASAGGEQYLPPYYCSGWGRPSDVMPHPRTGALLVTDEINGVVYLVKYNLPWYRTTAFIVAVPTVVGALAVMLVVFCVGRWLRNRREYTELPQASVLGVPGSSQSQ